MYYPTSDTTIASRVSAALPGSTFPRKLSDNHFVLFRYVVFCEAWRGDIQQLASSDEVKFSLAQPTQAFLLVQADSVWATWQMWRGSN